MSTERINIADHVKAKLDAYIKNMGGGTVDVGFLEGATYPDGTPVATVAFLDEFGHGGRFPSPPRSFFRTMVAKESVTWGPKMAAMLKKTQDGSKTLAWMGQDIDGALKRSIIETNSPPLSPTTLRLRAKFGNKPENIRMRDVIQAQKEVKDGFKLATGTQAKPLIWTGFMLASTGYEVKD
jgi:hypothetical protein